MASDEEVINDVYDIANNLPDIAEAISQQFACFKKNVDMDHLRSLHPRFNEALAVLCGIVEACPETGGAGFTKKTFPQNKKLLQMVKQQKTEQD